MVNPRYGRSRHSRQGEPVQDAVRAHGLDTAKEFDKLFDEIAAKHDHLLVTKRPTPRQRLFRRQRSLLVLPEGRAGGLLLHRRSSRLPSPHRYGGQDQRHRHASGRRPDRRPDRAALDREGSLHVRPSRRLYGWPARHAAGHQDFGRRQGGPADRVRVVGATGGEGGHQGRRPPPRRSPASRSRTRRSSSPPSPPAPREINSIS